MKLTGKWKALSSAVYENKNGTRIHTAGLIRFENKHSLFVNTVPYMEVINRFSIIAGNRKRGIMMLVDSMEAGA